MRAVRIIGRTAAAVAAAVIAALLFGCTGADVKSTETKPLELLMSEYEGQEEIQTVMSGCIGYCTDVRVGEMLEQLHGGGVWRYGRKEFGADTVEYRVNNEQGEFGIQFEMRYTDNFVVSGMSVNGSMPRSEAELADWVRHCCWEYYAEKYSTKNPDEYIPKVPVKRFLLGESAKRVELSKHPVEMSRYTELPAETAAKELELSRRDGDYGNTVLSIVEDYKTRKPERIYIENTRAYTLFGVTAGEQLDEAKEKLKAEFSLLNEFDKGDGTATAVYISRDMQNTLSLRYDTATSFVYGLDYITGDTQKATRIEKHIKEEAQRHKAFEAEWDSEAHFWEDEFVLPYSYNRVVSLPELQSLTEQELEIARSEIYARHGAIPKSSELSSYFNEQLWFVEDKDYDYREQFGKLSDTEIENWSIIDEYLRTGEWLYGMCVIK